MNRPSPTAFLRTRHLMALSLGLFLGQAVALMAQRENSWFGFAVATVFVASASASFVLLVLGQQRNPLSRAVLSRQAHGLAGLIGIGLLLSMRAVDWLA